MTHQFPHTFTDLPGHDPSKVRGADCITASKCEALDVRVLQVAEEMAEDAAQLRGLKFNTWAHRVDRTAETLRVIAAEIRDAATPPAPRTTATLIAELTNATTEPALARAWRDVAPSLRTMMVGERQTITEAFITRLCTMKRGQG